MLGFAGSVPAEEPIRIAILPIVVYSMDGAEYLRRGLGDMLASRIGRDPRLAVLPVADDGAATSDPDSARQTARALGADYVLYGSFTRFGEGASLDLQCASVLEEGVRTRELFVQSGTLGEIIPKLDPLAEKIVRYVAGTAPAAPEPVGPVERNGSAGATVEELRARVEALEKVVFEAERPPPRAQEEEAAEESFAAEGEAEEGGSGLELEPDGDLAEAEAGNADPSPRSVR